MTDVPRRIGDRMQDRWEIHHIHNGGMGIVYIVYDHVSHLPYAAKSFHGTLFTSNPGLAERFRSLARVWSSLGPHYNSVQAHFVEDIDGQPFLFLEHVGAGSLADWIGTPRLTHDLPQVLRFAIQCCDGLIHASAGGLQVHRDLKPHNCLITPERTLKVTDGGLAALCDGMHAAQDLTEALPGQRLRLASSRTGMFAGTGTHLAPELFDDPRGADVRSDIYAFGVMLFQMLTGKLPFEAQTWSELAHLHQTQPPPPLTPPFTALNPLIERCLAKDPAQRLADFLALRELLATLYTHLTHTQAPQPLVGIALEATQQDNIGSSLASLGQHEEALGWHDRALELQPHYEPAVVHQSIVLEALGRNEEALAFCNRVLESNPQSEAALVQKGLVLGLLGRMDEARGSCDQALALNPRNEQAWVNIGVALEALERPMEALASYNNAVTLNPRMEQAWFNAAVLLGDLEQHVEALRCTDRTLEINPRNERAWVNKGLTLRELRRPQEALECLERALALNPRLEQAWFNKGVLLVNEFQRHAEALPCFEAAQELGHAQAAEGIALCREALG